MNFSQYGIAGFSPIMLSVVFGALGFYLVFDFFKRTQSGNGMSRVNWLSLVALIHGSAVWSVVVLSTMASDVGLHFEHGQVFAALLVSLACTTAGYAVALNRRLVLAGEIGGAVLGVGAVATAWAVSSSVGSGLVAPEGYDSAFFAYLIAVMCPMASLSVATRIGRGHSVAVSAAFACAGLLALLSGAMLPSLAAAPIGAFAGVTSDIVLVPVTVVMCAVLGTALVTYNIENQSRREAIAMSRDLTVIDSMTGLPKREALRSHIETLIGQTDPEKGKFAVLAINLNRFRMINDVHGSNAGDIVLKEVAHRMMEALAPGEFLARASGDEFYAVKAGMHRIGEAQAFAARLAGVLSDAVVHKSLVLDISASIGGTVFPVHSDNYEELVAQAETAMLRAKQSSAGDIAFFDPSQDKMKREINVLAADLKSALANKEFELYYQPQHDVTNGRLIGFEALIRWNHPSRGMVPPHHFIPAAEKTGLINDIGAWVIREACSHAAEWPGDLKLAVNVAVSQIARNDLPRIVEEALAASGLDPDRLELEITETGLVSDTEHAVMILRKIKDLGCKVAMDDFGTGYSSLSTFKLFPFDKIKIDRAFVSDLSTARISEAVVSATLTVGKKLGIKVLAEGVENETQLAKLRELGCDEVQGYFFGKPMPLSELPAVIMSSFVQQQDGQSNVVTFKKA